MIVTSSMPEPEFPNDGEAGLTGAGSAAPQRLTADEVEQAELRARLAEARAREEAARRSTGHTTAGLRGLEDEDDRDLIGEHLPDLVVAVSGQCVGTPVRQILRIFNGTFKEWDLIKLRPARARPAADPLTTAVAADGTLTWHRSVHTVKDYGTVMVWAECFVLYMRIIGLLFGAQHTQVMPAMCRYLILVLRKAVAYRDAEVIIFAMHWAQQALTKGPLLPESWAPLPDEYTADLLGAEALRKPPSVTGSGASERAGNGRKRKASDIDVADQVCNKFNAGTCSFPGCRRRHACTKCGKDGHPATACPKAG
jgi:hypothetical protein